MATIQQWRAGMLSIGAADALGRTTVTGFRFTTGGCSVW
jgi:hypothetical protein